MKQLYTMMLAILMLAMLCVGVGAEELPIIPEVTVPESEGATVDTTDSTEDKFTEAPDAPYADDETLVGNDDGAEDNGVAGELEGAVKAWTTAVIDWIYEHRNDITSACGAAAFAVYAFLYKRKLLPSVDSLKDGVCGVMNEVIGNVQGAVDTFSSKLTVQQQGWLKDIEAIAANLKKYEEVLAETQKQQASVLSLEQRLAESDQRNAVYCATMRAQVEMIHQTLSSACLDDEQHAANHKTYLKMLALLEEAEAAAKAVATEEEDEEVDAV